MKTLHTVVIPVFDPKDELAARGLLDRCLDSVVGIEGDIDLIVVNTTGVAAPRTGEYLASASARMDARYVEAPERIGTSAVVNLALKMSRPSSSTIVFMSQDAEAVQPEVLGVLGEALEATPQLSVVHPCSVFEDNEEYNIAPEFSASISSEYSSDPSADSDGRLELDEAEIAQCLAVVRQSEPRVRSFWSFPLTFAMLRRDVLANLGGFDERFWYCHENNDYSLRSLQVGFVVGRADAAFVNHRRFLFRAAGVAGDGLSINRAGHDEGMDRWIEKWGAPYWQVRMRLGAQ